LQACEALDARYRCPVVGGCCTSLHRHDQGEHRPGLRRVGHDKTHFSTADIFEPRQVINDEIVRRYLDFSQPIALFQISTLHHYDCEPGPQSIMAECIDALPSSSYVTVSHFFDPEIVGELSELAAATVPLCHRWNQQHR